MGDTRLTGAEDRIGAKRGSDPRGTGEREPGLSDILGDFAGEARDAVKREVEQRLGGSLDRPAREIGQDLFVNAVLLALFPPGRLLGGDLRAALHVPVKNLFTNLAHFIQGLGAGVRSADYDTLPAELFELWGESLEPDVRSILKVDFVTGFFKGLEQKGIELAELVKALARFVTDAEYRDQATGQLIDVVKFVFGANHRKFHLLGRVAARKTHAELRTMVKGGEEAFNERMGYLASTLVVDLLIKQGAAKALLRVGKFRIVRLAGKVAPDDVLDAESRKLLPKEFDQQIAGTGGIEKITAAVMPGGPGKGDLLVEIRGRILEPLRRGIRRQKRTPDENLSEAKNRELNRKLDMLEEMLDKGNITIAPNFNDKSSLLRAKEVGLEPNEAALRKLPERLRALVRGVRWERAHLWGPGFGDEAAAGLWYARREINQAVQNLIVERWIRTRAKVAAAEGGKVEVAVRGQRWDPREISEDYRLLREATGATDRGEFLKSIEYSMKVTDSNGKVHRHRIGFQLEPPPDGRVRRGSWTSDESAYTKTVLRLLRERLEPGAPR